MPIHVKDGTAIGSQSRCVSSEHSHILRGFRESQEVTYCYYASLMVVPFKVRDCSNYSDKTRPSWEQMEYLAIDIRPTPTLKSVGFKTGTGFECEVTVAEGTDTRQPVAAGEGATALSPARIRSVLKHGLLSKHAGSKPHKNRRVIDDAEAVSLTAAPCRRSRR